MIVNRDFRFDFARALCVLWIVGFWHLINYLSQECRLEGNSLVICKEITYGVLACFTFLSGYFLKKYDFNNIDDILIFYKKRLLRFYPLFVVASFCLLVCGGTFKQVIFAILGLSLFAPPAIPTLWYFSMLLLFYLFTPMLKVKDTTKIRIVFLLLFIAVIVLGYFFADQRLIMYFPFYVLGLNLSNRIVERIMNFPVFIITILLFVGLCIVGSENLIIQIVQAMAGVCTILSFSKLVYKDKIQRPVSFIAEASMCAYLFHRPIYAVFTFVLGKSKPFHYMPIYVAIVAVVILFITSYFVQKYYNRIINQITIRNGK